MPCDILLANYSSSEMVIGSEIGSGMSNSGFCADFSYYPIRPVLHKGVAAHRMRGAVRWKGNERRYATGASFRCVNAVDEEQRLSS